MKTEEIFAGNRLLAEFMKTKSSIVNDMYCGADGILYSVENLRYHFSWDWLMPVVEKIERLGYDVFINGLYCRITSCGLSEFEIESGEVSTKIEAVWLACVEFVKWWNEEQQ